MTSPMLQVIVIVVSILTLTAISVERWFAICRPLTFRQTKTRVVGCLLFIWTSSHLVAIPRLFFFDTIPDDMIPRNVTRLMTSCRPLHDMQKMVFHYEIFLCVIFYTLPIIIMGYTYIAIAFNLWSSARTGILTGRYQKCNHRLF